MTPDQISALTAIAAILQQVDTWPIGTLIVCVILGPWCVSLLVSRAQEKRFEAVKEMYENNVDLVKNWESISTGLMDCVMLNTNKWSEVSQKIDTNQYCPLCRSKKIRMEDVPG